MLFSSMCYNAMILRINSALLSAVKQLMGNFSSVQNVFLYFCGLFLFLWRPAPEMNGPP